MKNVNKVKVSLEGKEWTSILDATFKKKQKDIKIDGFRKGSVTKEVFIKKLGIESLYPDAIDEALNVAYKKALNESKLIPIIQPDVDVLEIDEKHVTFEFTIFTKPEVTLGTYKNLKVKKEAAKVTKEELDAEIEKLRTKLAEIVVKDKGKLEDKNTAVIDFDGVVDGEKLEGGSGTDYPLEIGSNTFIPGFESGLVGMKVGETKTLDLKFPTDYTPELKDKPVTFTVTLKAIKERIIPELGKDLYEDLGFKDVKTESEFRSEIEKTLLAKKEANIEDDYIEACLEKAADNMKIDINKEIIEEEVHHMRHQYEEKLKMQGLTLEQYMQFSGQTEGDLNKAMEPEATKRVKYRYLIEAVADKEKITVTDKEVDEEAEKAAKNYDVPVDEFIKMIGGKDMLEYDIKMRRAVEIIKS